MNTKPVARELEGELLSSPAASQWLKDRVRELDSCDPHKRRSDVSTLLKLLDYRTSKLRG